MVVIIRIQSNRVYEKRANLYIFWFKFSVINQPPLLFKTWKKTYNRSMDDRKRQIGELEQRKREQIVSLEMLLTRLGETLLGREAGSGQEDTAFQELADFRRLKKDIVDSEAAILAVEDQIRRFRELEESIEAKEQEENAGSKEMAGLYGRLGKLLLDETAGGGAYADFCAPYRDQAEALLTKVISLEERVAGLESREGGNVFTWIGKNAQGLVVRSFLTKAQENLDQLRRTVGERYSRCDVAALPAGETGSVGEVENLCDEIERKRVEVRALSQDIAELKEERRTISVSYNSEGGPIKQIQTLKNHIALVRDELKALYRRIGAEMAGIDGAGNERRQIIDSLIAPEDREDLDNAARMSQSIHNDEMTIAKLQASLDIDEEKARIEKYRGMIAEKREKIAQAEKNIMEYEENIRISEASIEKLGKIAWQ